MKLVSVPRKENGSLDQHGKGQKHRNRVPLDKQTLLTGNINKIMESSCAIKQKASDTINQTTNQRSNELDKPTSY